MPSSSSRLRVSSTPRLGGFHGHAGPPPHAFEVSALSPSPPCTGDTSRFRAGSSPGLRSLVEHEPVVDVSRVSLARSTSLAHTPLHGTSGRGWASTPGRLPGSFSGGEDAPDASWRVGTLPSQRSATVTFQDLMPVMPLPSYDSIEVDDHIAGHRARREHQRERSIGRDDASPQRPAVYHKLSPRKRHTGRGSSPYRPVIVHRAEVAYVADDHPRAWQRVGASITGSALRSKLSAETSASALGGSSMEGLSGSPFSMRAGSGPALGEMAPPADALAEPYSMEILKARREKLARDVLLLTADQPRAASQFGMGMVLAV